MPHLSLLTLCAAGAINASFALPMKFMRKWSWENTWLVWAFFALLVLPMALGVLAIPRFLPLLLSPSAAVVKIALFGALWGVGQVLFGFALETIGISLATLIMLGISAGVGTLVPLAAAGEQHLMARTVAVIAALALMLGGVVLCACAGRERGTGSNSGRGILYAVGAGLGAGLFNFSLAFGGSLVEQALAAGSKPALAQLAAWTPFLLAGALANFGYCTFRLRSNGSYRKFAEPGTIKYWLGGLVMAALWLGSALLYGAAVHQIGRWGAIFAWPVYMSLIVLGSVLVGMAAGEWRTASRRTLVTMSSGLVVIVIAAFVITCAQHV